MQETSPANPDHLVTLARRHAAAEGGQDLEALMATMEGEPVYEFHPLGKSFTGMAQTRRFYTHFMQEVAPRIEAVLPLSEAVGPQGLIQEYRIRITLAGQTAASTHHIMAILVFGKAGLSGERMFSDDAFFRTLIGPLWGDLQPIDLSF